MTRGAPCSFKRKQGLQEKTKQNKTKQNKTKKKKKKTRQNKTKQKNKETKQKLRGCQIDGEKGKKSMNIVKLISFLASKHEMSCSSIP